MNDNDTPSNEVQNIVSDKGAIFLNHWSKENPGTELGSQRSMIGSVSRSGEIMGLPDYNYKREGVGFPVSNLEVNSTIQVNGLHGVNSVPYTNGHPYDARSNGLSLTVNHRKEPADLGRNVVNIRNPDNGKKLTNHVAEGHQTNHIDVNKMSNHGYIGHLSNQRDLSLLGSQRDVTKPGNHGDVTWVSCQSDKVREAETEDEDVCQDEWTMVAYVLDRCFLIIYLILSAALLGTLFSRR